MTTDRQSDGTDPQATNATGATTATTVASAALAAAMAASSAAAAAAALAQLGGKEQLVPAVRVRINNVPLLPQIVSDLIAVSVCQDVDAPGMFTIQLINWDMLLRRMTWSDDTTWFSPGNPVEIQMGYVNRQETLLVGEITALEPEFAGGETPKLTVRGYDRRHRMLRGQQTRSFVKMKDSDIAAQVAQQLGLTPQVQDTGVILDYVLQHNQTDLEFLQQRARRIGYEVVVEDRTLFFRPRQNNRPATVTLKRDVDLIEFYPRLSTVGKAAELTVRGWNPKDKRELVGRARMGDQAGMGNRDIGWQRAFGRAAGASVAEPVASQAEADQVARGQFNAMALSYIAGSGVCIGRTDLRAGQVIAIEGLGRRFSGTYYVTSATHTYSPKRGYRTAFEVKRNAR